MRASSLRARMQPVMEAQGNTGEASDRVVLVVWFFEVEVAESIVNLVSLQCYLKKAERAGTNRREALLPSTYNFSFAMRTPSW